MIFVLSLTDSSGRVLNITFSTALLRSLAVIALAAQPVVMRLEDVAVAA